MLQRSMRVKRPPKIIFCRKDSQFEDVNLILDQIEKELNTTNSGGSNDNNNNHPNDHHQQNQKQRQKKEDIKIAKEKENGLTDGSRVSSLDNDGIKSSVVDNVLLDHNHDN